MIIRWVLIILLGLCTSIHALSPAFLGEVVSGSYDYTQDDNCMGAWPMLSNGGNEADISGENATLVETGGTISTSSDVPVGYTGTSRDIELGDTEYFTQADGLSTDISGPAFSFGLWLKAESAVADMYILEKWNLAGDQRQFKLRTDFSDSGVFKFFLSSDGADNTQCIGTTDITTGSWFHVMLVYNNVNITGYVNGAVDSNGADNPKTYSGGIANKSAAFTIGADATVGELYFDGLFKDVIIFDRAISAGEVLQMYNNGIKGDNS